MSNANKTKPVVHEQPAAGGSYVRNPDGTLTPAKDRPATDNQKGGR